MFLINSKQLKEFISTLNNIYEVDKEQFLNGIEKLSPLLNTNEEYIEYLIIKLFFEKEIFYDLIDAKNIAEDIIAKSTEYEFYYFKLVGLLAFFEVCLQLNTVESETDYDSIIIEIKTLLKLEELKEIGILEKEIQFNITLANYEMYNGNYKRALEHISDSFSSHLKFLIDSSKRTYFEVLLLNLRAYLNFNLGNYQDTLLYMVRCLSLVKDLPIDLQNEVNLVILNNQCLIYRTIGEYELAQDFSQQLEEELGTSNINPFEMSNIYNNLGLFEAEQGNYQKSLDLLHKALGIHQTVTKSIQEQAISMGNIARILGESGDFLKAVETFNICLRMYDKSGSHKELVEKICWYIDVLLQENNLVLAEEYIKMAEHYALQHQSGRELILVEIRSAKWFINSEDLVQAKKLFIEIRSMADQNNQHRESIQCSLYLADVSLLQNDVTSLKEGLKECERVLGQSAQTSHFIYQIRALIIKAKINGLLLEFNSALYAIDDALTIAENKNLMYFHDQLFELKNQLIEKRKLLTASILDASTIPKDTLIKYIRLTTGKKLQLSDELVQKLEPYYMSLYALKDTKHHIILVESIPKEFRAHESVDPLTMALIFSTSLGQGNRYNEGLFVLPTPDYTMFNSIVYSKILPEFSSYIILAFNYHKELESLYYNRIEIEKYLTRILLPIINIEQLTTEFLKELKSGLNELILREINLKVSK